MPQEVQRWAGLVLMPVAELFKEEPGIHTCRSMVIWEKPCQITFRLIKNKTLWAAAIVSNLKEAGNTVLQQEQFMHS